MMIDGVSAALKSASTDYCALIESATPAANPADPQTLVTKPASLNLVETLAETELITDGFPELLEEALSEPNFWKRPFSQVKDRYDDISKALRRIILSIRFVHRCTTILKAQTMLHLAQEAK